jgi:hypothetical protein
MLAQNQSKTAISGEGITQAYDRVVNQVINYTTSSGIVLKANGDKKITGITIMRTPIEASALLKVARVSLEDKPYDKLFHLYMVVTMDDGKVLALEKTENIKLSVYDGRKGAEEFKISKVPSRTLSELLQKAETRMGYSYHRYDAIKNNCQDFLMNILNANKFGSSSAKAFIKQDVKGLVGSTAQKILTGATRVFGIAQTLLD